MSNAPEALEIKYLLGGSEQRSVRDAEAEATLDTCVIDHVLLRTIESVPAADLANYCGWNSADPSRFTVMFVLDVPIMTEKVIEQRVRRTIAVQSSVGSDFSKPFGSAGARKTLHAALQKRARRWEADHAPY